MVTEKTLSGAKDALPHLVYYAQIRETLTYEKLGNLIGRHPRFALSHILGYIRDKICIPKGLPLINAIVVRKYKGLPGVGFLPGGTKGLSKEEYRQKFEELRDEVFNCDRWDDLLKELGLKAIRKTPEDLDREAAEYIEVSKRAGGGESEEHKQLKKYIVRNPSILELSPDKEPETEFQFLSGDLCDVVMDLGKEGWAVIEIKQGQRGELVKGIYQAIKYRALMQAQEGRGQACNVKAFLVAYRIPFDIREYAERFGIGCREVTPL